MRGRSRIARPPSGFTSTSSSARRAGSPATCGMNGFHSGIAPEIGQRVPDALGRRVDLDHREELGEEHQAVPSIMCGGTRGAACAAGAGRFAGARAGTFTRNHAA